MKTHRIFTVFVAALVILRPCSGIMNMKKSKDLTVAGVLKDAKLPLSAEKLKQLSEFKVGGDREMFSTFFQIFDEKQNEANTLVEPDKNGRYVRVLGSDPVLTSTTLESLSPVPTQWFDTKIIKLSPLKSLTRFSAKGKELWKISRKSPKSPYIFDNLII